MTGSPRKAVRLAALTATVAAVMAAGCGNAEPAHPRLEFLGAVSLPLVDAPGGAGDFGGLATVGIAGTQGSVQVQSVQLVSDPGLSATYLGFTDCHKGCVGTALTDPQGLTLARTSLIGTIPADIPQEGDASRVAVSFVIEMHPTAAGWDRLRSGACLYVQGARVSFTDGTEGQVSASRGQWIAAVFIGHIAPAVNPSC